MRVIKIRIPETEDKSKTEEVLCVPIDDIYTEITDTEMFNPNALEVLWSIKQKLVSIIANEEKREEAEQHDKPKTTVQTGNDPNDQTP